MQLQGFDFFLDIYRNKESAASSNQKCVTGHVQFETIGMVRSYFMSKTTVTQHLAKATAFCIIT